jgi:hypothetical protein
MRQHVVGAVRRGARRERIIGRAERHEVDLLHARVRVAPLAAHSASPSALWRSTSRRVCPAAARVGLTAALRWCRSRPPSGAHRSGAEHAASSPLARTPRQEDDSSLTTWARRRDSAWDRAERSVLEHPALRDVYRALRKRGDAFPVSHFTGVTPRRNDHIYASPELHPTACEYLSSWLHSGLSDHALGLVLPDDLGMRLARRTPVVLAFRAGWQLDRIRQHVLVLDGVEDV